MCIRDSFLVMPGLFGGFGNYFVPIFIGSPEVVYPRVNNLSILIIPISYILVIFSILTEFGGGRGWTLYPPLSTSLMSLSPSSTGYILYGLLMSGISSCLTSINFAFLSPVQSGYFFILAAFIPLTSSLNK